MPIPVEKIDHLAVTVADLDHAISFYERVLEAEITSRYEFNGAVAVVEMRIGKAMLNVHQAGHAAPLVAEKPTPGAVDICFRWETPIGTAIEHLDTVGIEIIEGPVPRRASDGQAATSVYFRDLDGNLIELLSTVPARDW
jgi:catechol 2,3-dioxygenase-like lactoylglutathione lyase family enzyme